MGRRIDSPIPGVPAVRVQGRSGLLDVLLHPQFDTNRFIIFSYLKPAGAERQSVLTVARGRLGRLRRYHSTSWTSSVAARESAGLRGIAWGRDG